MANYKNARENVFLPEMESADTSKLQSTVPLYAVIDNKPLAAEELDPNYSAISMVTMNTENIYTEAAATSTKHSLQKSYEIKRVQKGKKLMYLLAISLSVVTLMLIFGCFVALFAEIATLKSKTTSLQQTPPSEQASSDSNIMFQINQSFADLENRLDSLTQIAFGFITQLEQKLNISINALEQFNQSLVNIEDRLIMHVTTTGELEQKLNTSINTFALEQFNQSLENIEDQFVTTTGELEQKLNNALEQFNQSLENIEDQLVTTTGELEQKLNTSINALEQFNQSLETIEDQLVTTTGELEQKLNTSINALEQFNQSFEIIEDQLLTTTGELEQKINTSIDMNYQQLSNRLNTSIIQQMQLESTIANHTQQLNMIYEHILITSCAALPPSSPSGYYLVRVSNGSAVRVYCDMTRSCGGVTGGWMRVAELDMTNSSHQCPSNLKEYTISSKRICVINSTNRGACSTTLLSSALEYSKVCGKIIGYQIGTTDGFRRNPEKDQNYVDGVTLTHGNPRQHIWTFAAALSQAFMLTTSNCPCTTTQPNSGTPPPAFVGQDYFCDTVSRESIIHGMLYGDNPLWDGAGCGPQSTCCSFNTPPWFYKQLPQSTTDDIEMRVCRDDGAINENIAIESVEIYVQ